MKEGKFHGSSQVSSLKEYRLEKQVGFLLRRANQRHLSIFGQSIDHLTPTQFAALAKLFEHGPMFQNDLGRSTAMDAATIKGVVDRLARKGLVATRTDQQDLRRVIASLTEAGEALITGMIPSAEGITAETLSPLDPAERETFLSLLKKMADAPGRA